MSTCSEVERFLRSTPAPEQHPRRVEVAEHLDACPRCRLVWLEVGDGSTAPGGARPAGPRADRPRTAAARPHRPAGSGGAEGRGDDPYATRAADDEHAEGSDGFWIAAEALAPAGHPAAEPDPSWPAVPGYKLIAKLGEGGMGVVYRAVHGRLNRPVALKMIRPDGPARAGQLDRFRAEAEAVARLRHPNIVQIYEIGDVAGMPYFSLELLTGGALDRKLAGAPQPARASAELVATLAAAMHAAHLARVVHRDLKPANVVLDADGTPKITDFGLAKRIEDDEASQTQPGEIMGSPCYMAPEQARGDNLAVGPSTDIYALGAILYEMLTGRPPFRGVSSWDTVLQVIHQDPVPPSRLQHRVPRDLETVCLKCLAKEPAGRYASAQHLGEDLRRYLAGVPILARPTPFWVRAWKWGRRHPAAAALALVAVLATVGGVAGAVGLRQAKQRRDTDLLFEVSDGLTKARSHLGSDPTLAVDLLARALGQANDRLLAGPQPRLEGLRSQIKELQTQAVASAKRATDRVQFDRDRGDFWRAHDRALRLATDPLGLKPPGRMAEAGRAARQALEVFAAPPPDAGPWAYRPDSGLDRATADDRTRIIHGVCAMLMVLAEAEAREDQGGDPRAQAARGWEILRAGAGLADPTGLPGSYHRRQATYLIRMGRPADAAREEAEAGRPDPTAYDSFLAGLEALRAGDFAAAIRSFDAAREGDPANFWARALLTSCYQQLRDFQAARLVLDGFADLPRDEPWLLILRGVATHSAARSASQRPAALAEAEADFRRAEAWLRDQPEQPDLLRFAVQNNWGQAILLGDPARLDEAERHLRGAVALAPGRPEAKLGLAIIAQRRGDAAATVAAASRVIDEDPAAGPLADALLVRAEAHATLARRPPGTPAAPTDRETAAMIADFARAIDLKPAPDRPGLQGLFAGRLHESGRHAEAIEQADAALGAAPGSFDALRVRVEAAHALHRDGRADQRAILRACDDYLAVAKVRPEPPTQLAALYRYRAQCQRQLGDIAATLNDYGLAIDWETRPEVRVDLLRERGWVRLATADKESALADFRRAAEFRPDDPGIILGLANACAELGDDAQALAHVEHAGRAAGPSAQDLFRAARVYALVDQHRRAQAQATRSPGPPRSLGDRALQLLSRSLLAREPAERARFFRVVVDRDRAFAGLGRSPEYARLARRAETDGRPQPPAP